MRVVVDLNRCQGYGQCVFAAPSVFWMDGSEALFFDYNPDKDQRENVVAAAAACPVHAISIDHADLREAGYRDDNARSAA